MLLLFASIFFIGLLFEEVFVKLKLPSLLGLLIAGIILGPSGLNLIDAKILSISADLRQVALIILLLRAGLNLKISDLAKVGRPALLMCFVPASFEIMGVLILAPKLLNISLIEAGILGTVIAAVSPAVIVPRMLMLMNEGYGKEKSIPQMIMAGGAADDIFVILLFTVFTGLAHGEAVTMSHLLKIPGSVIFGLIAGISFGLILSALFKKIHLRDTQKVLIVLSVSFLFVSFEHAGIWNFGFSGLLAVMSMGAVIQKKKSALATRLSEKFSKLWVCAEILLFVLVGASVDIDYALKAGIVVVLLILGVSLFRMCGVLVCLLRTNLNKKERLFTAMAYLPKATVQAAIGGLPLSMGLACGEIVLTTAVASILITAPLGAKLIDMTYTKLLNKDTV